MKKTIIIIFFFSFRLNAQIIEESDSLTIVQRFVQQNKFFHNFLFPDSTSQNHLFTTSLDFQTTVHSSNFKASGLHISVGVNLARFFSKKIIIGLTYDLKPVRGGFKQNFSSEFLNDFNTSFRSDYRTSSDSALANTLKSALNSNGFNGNYFAHYGLMFSLFPQKYGGILVSLKTGILNLPVITYDHPNNLESGKNDFSIHHNYSVELTVKPYTFFKNSYINIDHFKWGWQSLKFITISVYYEKLNLKQASFGTLPLADMVSSDFMAKYGYTHTYGFKVGLALY